MNKFGLVILGKKGYDVLVASFDYYSEMLEFVVIGKDKNVKNDFFEESRVFCIQNKVDIYERQDIRSTIQIFRGFIFVIGWRWMLPEYEKLIIIHDSLLPKYRGFAPLVNALINGDEKIGVSALYASANYDEGDLISQISIDIKYPIKVSDAIEKVSKLYCDIILEILEKIKNHENLLAFPQDNSSASFSLWRDEKDYFINWENSSDYISRFIDSLGSPYAGARCFLNNEIVIINSAKSIEDLNIVDRQHVIGKVIKINQGFPVVVCGEGLLIIESMFNLQGDSILPLKKFRSRFH